jgi:hypothetical protein
MRIQLVCCFALVGCGDDGGKTGAVDAPMNPPVDMAVSIDAPGTMARCDRNKPFGPATALTMLNTSAEEENPWLTADELTLYFDSTRTGVGDHDIWMAKRTSIDQPFANPTIVPNVNTAGSERNATLTGDGLSMYAMRQSATYDIVVASRPSLTGAWSTFAVVNELNAANKNENNPFIMPDNSAIYFASDRGGNYDLYRAPKNSAAFGTPELVESTSLNFASADIETQPMLTPDELTMYFWSNRAGGVGAEDIYEVKRASKSEKWGAPVNLSAVNTSGPDYPGWVSADGCVLYFTHVNGAQQFDLYVAQRPQ